MKKLAFVASIMFIFFFSAEAQLEMNEYGNVGIGTNPSSTWKLSVEGITRLNNVDTRLYVSSDYISFYHEDREEDIIFGEYDGESSFWPEGDDCGYIGTSSKSFYSMSTRYLWVNGNQVTSDIRLKENIRTLDSQLKN
ncbi:MAG TPA: hypothetical protein VJ963_12325 [Bacteroidales bacterium]|nr:hypothetical protein [Bacteroidales bacterium]